MKKKIAEQQLNTALYLLDFGRVEKATDILNTLILETQKDADKLIYIHVSCILGELLFLNGEVDKAKTHLLNVLNTPYKNNLVDYEKSNASEILNKIQ